MRGKWILFLCLSICTMAITSCEKKDCCLPVRSEGSPLSHLIISVKNNQGDDLLNPTSPHSFRANNISLELLSASGSEKVSYNEKSNEIKIIKHPSIKDLYVLLLKPNLKLDHNSKSKNGNKLERF